MSQKQSAAAGIDTGFLLGSNSPEGQGKLSGQMSALALCLTVLAFSAPIAVVEGFIPFTIMFDGPGAAIAYLITGLVLMLFAIGYVSMTRYIPKVGNFYSFVSAGLGRSTGLGAAFLAVFAYLGLLGGTYVFLGVSASSLIESVGGATTSWITWAVVGWMLVSTLGFFHIELSAKVLSIAMVIEVLIVLVFNVGVLLHGGQEGLVWEAYTPGAFAQGDMAVTMLYTVLVFIGFEATALFRDEVRDPARTIPKATYAAVIFIALFYSLSAFALISAYGDEAWDVAKSSPANMFAEAIGHFVAPVFKQIAYFSVVISLIAALLSIHNVLSRYLLNLSSDGALPKFLAKVHRRHQSPHMASSAVAFIVAIGVLPIILSGADGSSLYGIATGLGGLGIIFLMVLVCLAIMVWFMRTGVPAGESIFKVFIAPALAGVTLLSVAIFAVLHIDLVVGGASIHLVGSLICAGVRDWSDTGPVFEAHAAPGLSAVGAICVTD